MKVPFASLAALALISTICLAAPSGELGDTPSPIDLNQRLSLSPSLSSPTSPTLKRKLSFSETAQPGLATLTSPNSATSDESIFSDSLEVDQVDDATLQRLIVEARSRRRLLDNLYDEIGASQRVLEEVYGLEEARGDPRFKELVVNVNTLAWTMIGQMGLQVQTLDHISQEIYRLDHQAREEALQSMEERPTKRAREDSS
ncbi:hypothetical protein IWQ60_006507 [Tieghemiomyces parasiticus]|uniref:Uncharacterized protein n=1 Tax=Tieghemiomyces parasiticus TaxID=78921 RepID=A0A9W8AC18_9FUNG|nr:hypothetical protein IWQ60_006507 [Tieghemiomyces parasiticus]